MSKKQRPLPTSAPYHERPIDLLDKLYSRLMLGHRYSVTVGEGTKRRREREAAQRKVKRKVPMGPIATRQQRRRERILRERQALTVAKREVAGIKTFIGGSAVMRNADDIKAVFG